MGKRMLGGLTFKELSLKTWRGINADNIYGGAAELSYYFLLALFPMLIFLTSLVGFLPGAQQAILVSLGRVVPGQAMKLVNDTLQDVINNRSGGLLSFGILGTLWAASVGVAALMETLNVVYCVKEGRSFWKVRLIAVGLTIILSSVMIGGTVLIMFGDKLSAWLAGELGLGSSFAVAWGVVDYLLGLVLLLIGIDLIYYFAPNIKLRWRVTTFGSGFALIALIVVSLLFSLYLRVAPSYSATYGSLGAVIVLMLWLYLVGLVILTGGKINAIIREALNKPKILKEVSTNDSTA
jgi:membrane protein